MAKVFFDTNILVYELDQENTAKRDVCRKAIAEAVSRGESVISTQVLQEFYAVTTSKLHLDPLRVKSALHTLRGIMEVVTVTPELIDDAIDVSLRHKLSFWDALILVAAESAQCGLLYSEDLHDGQVIGGVRIVNPLR